MNPKQAKEVSVRPLRETDLDDWFRLRKMLWDETADDDHRSEMIDILDHHDSQFVVFAEAGAGRLVGFLEASIRPFVEDCETDHVGYLEGWFVEIDYRKQGIGRELVRQAEAWAREKGCTEMASDAEIGNDLSLEAHLNLGYAETSRLVHLRKEL
jgi:aminoglycoside 6'-N-acetyltransferase I